MSFDDIKDQVKDKWAELQDQLEESTVYNNFKEKFLEFPVAVQRVIVVGGLLFGAWLVMALPMSYMSSASESIDSYDSQLKLIDELFEYGRVDPSMSGLPQGESLAGMISVFRSSLQSFQLLSEQIVEVKEASTKEWGEPTLATPPIIQSHFQVKLQWLTVQQIIDIGFRLQSLKSHVRMLGLDIQEDREKNHYYNVTYKFAGFSLPKLEVEDVSEDGDEKVGKGGKKKRKKLRKRKKHRSKK